jgi:hypothetical protein
MKVTDRCPAEERDRNDTQGLILPLLIGFGVVMTIWTIAVTVAIVLGA